MYSIKNSTKTTYVIVIEIAPLKLLSPNMINMNNKTNANVCRKIFHGTCETDCIEGGVGSPPPLPPDGFYGSTDGSSEERQQAEMDVTL